MDPEDQLTEDEELQLAGQSDDSTDDESQQQQQAQQQEDKPQHTVPLAVLLDERRTLQAQIRELEQQTQKFAGLEQQIRDMREAAKTAKTETPQVPDFINDPRGYIDAQVAASQQNVSSLVERIKELETAGKATKEQVDQADQISQMQTTIKASVDSFANKTPDFDNALQYAREHRLQQLKLAYPDANDAQLQSALAVEEFRTASAIVQQGRNPGEFIYAFAKTIGYKPTEGQQQQQGQMTDAERQAMADKRANAEGLGSGTSDTGELTGLLEAADDEFDAIMRETFGGAS